MDLRVSVTGGVHFDLVKRVLRDIKRSGQAPEEIIQQVYTTCFLASFQLHPLAEPQPQAALLSKVSKRCLHCIDLGVP